MSEKGMVFNFRYITICVALALLVCVAQIIGNVFLIFGCLIVFLLLIGWTSFQSFTLPILLFFLPWSRLLKVSVDSFSFYTFALVLVCGIGVFQQKLILKKYHILSVFGLTVLTLFSKLINGYSLSFYYVSFMLLLIIFPVVKAETEYHRYDFFHIVIYFSVGMLFAALCASLFSHYPNIRQYINVYSYLTITRTSGFYWDPNFYMAQIAAALGGCLVLLLRTTNKIRIICLGSFIFVLLYYGFMSGSKTFVLIVGVLALLWVVELIKMREKAGLRFILIFSGMLMAIYIASSSMFSDLIKMLLLRFSTATDLSSFTTRRTDLWASYIEALLSDTKLLLFGVGYTDIYVDNWAAHNTVLQILYQFGVVGTVMLIAWILLFFQDIFKVRQLKKHQMINTLILLIGAFFSWFALDVLFSDEFFLLQWFVYMGMQELLWSEETKKEMFSQNAGKYGRMRLKWR